MQAKSSAYSLRDIFPCTWIYTLSDGFPQIIAGIVPIVIFSINDDVPFYLPCSFKLASASVLLPVIIASVWQLFNSEQSPHVAYFFLCTHFRISHMLSQNGVFTPSVRHPVQLIISAVICA